MMLSCALSADSDRHTVVGHGLTMWRWLEDESRVPSTTLARRTVEELNKLLDVDQPWTWIVHDASGLSTVGAVGEVVCVSPTWELDNAPWWYVAVS